MTIALDDFTVEIGQPTSYYDEAIVTGALGFWPLTEQLTATGARTAGTNTTDGVYTGGVTLGHMGPLPHGGTAALFNGTTGYVTMGDVAAFEFTGAFTVQFLFKTDGAASAIMGMVNKCLTNAAGWGVWMSATGGVRFICYTSAPASIFDITSSGTYDDDEWHHVICTWTGDLTANGATIYVDGVNVGQATANAGTPATNTAPLLIGAIDNGGPSNFFKGYIHGAQVYSGHFGVGLSATHYASTQWTDITDDVLAQEGLSLEYGTAGVGPLDRLASSGTLEFTLDNSVYNSAGLVGYYAPLHANCRTGFTFNVPIRVQMTYAGLTRTKFWGRIAVIDPEPGVNASRLTRVLAHDFMYALVDADVRELTAQLNVTDRDALLQIFEALPHDVQPMAMNLDAGVDTFDYVFDDLKGGVKAATAIKRIVDSGWSRAYVFGDGTFRWLDRAATTNQVIDFDLDDSEIIDLESPSDRSHTFEVVRVVTHPKTIDTSNVVTFAHPGKAFVPANGGTVEIWGTYRNPDNDLQTIGATSHVTPVSGTDFSADSAEDGSGSDLTASVTVSADFFASTVKLLLTNNHATLGAYFVDPTTGNPKLQTRGIGIYDKAPVTSEAGAGDRPLSVDLPYQGDAAVGQEIADFILNEREAITDPVNRVTTNPHVSEKLMEFALDGEPGTLLTVTEEQTGLDQAQALVRSVRLQLEGGEILTAEHGLTPIVVGYQWILDDADFSVLDVSTVFAAVP